MAEELFRESEQKESSAQFVNTRRGSGRTFTTTSKSLAGRILEMICSGAVSPENDIACLGCLTGSLSLGPTNVRNQAPTFSANNRSGHKIVVQCL
jgi:hypothetical protein